MVFHTFKQIISYDAYASEMCRKGIVDYVVTEDMDTLAFGCPKTIRRCLDKSIKRSDVISIIDLETILSKFEMIYAISRYVYSMWL